MTTSNPLTEQPPTPPPDLAGSSDSEWSPEASPPMDPLEAALPFVAADSTADDINLLLTTSIAKPEPDPMLGPADPTGLDIGVRLTPSPDATAGDLEAERPRDGIDRIAADGGVTANSWTIVLLASYSSAVTLALIWVLATNRGFKRPEASVPPPPAIDLGRTAAKTFAPAPPENRITALGSPLIVGDIEVTPVQIRFQDVNLFRIVDLEGSERRRVADCLVLTLRLTNRSRERRITPIELAAVRDTGDSTGDSFIESATGERIAMFELAMESEWSIEDQSFPSVRPGRSEDVILVSEPIIDQTLASPLVWRVTIQTDAGESEEIGVRFDRQEIGAPIR